MQENQSQSEIKTKNERYFRNDFADEVREFITRHKQPYLRNIRFDERGDLMLDDPTDDDKGDEGLNKWYEEFRLSYSRSHGEAMSVNELYPVFALIQQEHDDLVISMMRDNEHRTLTYQITLK